MVGTGVNQVTHAFRSECWQNDSRPLTGQNRRDHVNKSILQPSTLLDGSPHSPCSAFVLARCRRAVGTKLDQWKLRSDSVGSQYSLLISRCTPESTQAHVPGALGWITEPA